jgi:hypothetical protein
VADLFAQAADALLESLASLATTTGRNQLKDGLVDAVVGTATDLLESNDVYKHWVPSDVKSAVRSSLRSALRSALNSGVVDVVLEAVGDVASALDDLVDDVRELDPGKPLAPQLLELALDRIEDAVESAFGDDPHIDLGFDATWQYTEVVWVGPAPWDFGTRKRTASFHIDLGRIDIPLDDILSVVRQVGRDLGALQTAIQGAAATLASAFAAEQDLQSKETEKSGLDQEQATLEKRRRETAPGPRSIEILSPAPLQVVDRTTSVRIRIEGVPDSIIEEGPDAPPRLLVFLNGEPVPLATFQVTPLASSAQPPIAGTGIDVGLPGIPGRPGRPSNLGLLLPAHSITGTTLRGVDAHVGARARPAANGGAAGLSAARSIARERTVDRLIAHHEQALRAAREASVARGRARSTDRNFASPADAVSHGGAKGRELGFVYESAALRSVHGLGRPLSLAHLGALATSESDGLILTRTLDPSQLHDGVNALSVVLLDGQGQRAETTVSFLSIAAPAADPGDKRPTLPSLHMPLPERLRPLVIAGSRGLLMPKAKRRAAAQATVAKFQARHVDPLRKLRQVSPVVGSRLTKPLHARAQDPPRGAPPDERRGSKDLQ